MTLQPAATTPAASGRERLLAAALRLFAAKGYAATSVRDILRAAGVTAPVLYHHFGSKEGLFLFLARDAKAKVEAARARALGAGGSAAARIVRLCRAHSAVRRQYADLAWVVEQILSGPPEAAPPFDFRAVALESLRLFEGLVEEGIASGEFRACPPRHAALALMGVVEIAARPHIFDPGGGRSDEQLEGMLTVLLSGLAAARADGSPFRAAADTGTT
ncbi:MAG: TetR/AcrR family transcriptional regulator [Thermoanaerobaculia bacterium]|nr:MAG: TetR/AcrR family transcriptional regulator [Thermoanaerobaculia bacterium]